MGRMPGGGRAIGGGAGLLIVVIGLLFGVNLGGGDLGGLDALDEVTAGQTRSGGSELAAECQTGADANEREDCRIVGTSTASRRTGARSSLARASGTRWRPRTSSAARRRRGCGGATSAVGPFYCPADQSVYIDLGFFDDLRDRFGA